MTVRLPDSHLNLLTNAIHAVLTTMMADGTAQSSIIWVDYDGEHILVNTTLERQKGRNMQANPKVSVLLIDPQDTSRWLEIRGKVVGMTAVNAEAHADRLTHHYTGQQHFYGDIYPVDQRAKEHRVIVIIEPVKISLDAIFR